MVAVLARGFMYGGHELHAPASISSWPWAWELMLPGHGANAGADAGANASHGHGAHAAMELMEPALAPIQ